MIQNYRPIEIEVGDDSPSDDSEELVLSLSTPEGISVRYARNTPGLGQSGNVNNLFSRARGRLLLLLHDDDVLTAGALDAMYKIFESIPNLVAVYGLQQIIRENGELETNEFNRFFKRTSRYFGLQDDPVLSALWRQFPNDGYLVDADAARSVGYRSFEDIGEACDTDFALRLALRSRPKTFFLLDKATCRYRINANALSGSRDHCWRFYDYLLQLSEVFTPTQIDARNSLLRQIAIQSLTENALHGRRRAALDILVSGYYPAKSRSELHKIAYHLALIVFPQLDRLRPRLRTVIQ